ncbi:hypothetical protein CCH79_00018511, partial [Gambusia affinis]
MEDSRPLGTETGHITAAHPAAEVKILSSPTSPSVRHGGGGKSLPTLNETLDVYEAEEHSNATLTWIHPDPNATPSDWFYFDLMSMKLLRKIYVFNSRVQPEPYTDDEFKGRLHCDPQLVRNGRIRCLLTEVRFSDAGRYQWYVVTDGGRDVRDWELVVRASIPQTQEETQEPVDRGRFYLIFFLLFINQQHRDVLVLTRPGAAGSERREKGLCREEEVLNEPSNQVENSTLAQEKPEPLQIKPEPLQIKQEQEEPEPLQIKPEPLQIKQEQQEPEPLQIKQEQEEPEPLQIKQEPEEPEPLQIEQEEPEPQQIKQEQEEPEHQEFKEEEKQLCISQDEEHLVLKQETDHVFMSPYDMKRIHNETEPQMNQLISHGSAEDENQDQERSNFEDPGKKRKEEQKQNERCQKTKQQK